MKYIFRCTYTYYQFVKTQDGFAYYQPIIRTFKRNNILDLLKAKDHMSSAMTISVSFEGDGDLPEKQTIEINEFYTAATLTYGLDEQANANDVFCCLLGSYDPNGDIYRMICRWNEQRNLRAPSCRAITL